MAERGKTKAVTRDPSVSICVLDEQWPPSYLLAYCKARIVTEFEQVVDLRMRIAGVMAQQAIPESHRPFVAETSRKENRVMLRLTPYATFETPPRHVAEPDDVKGLTHWLGSTLPWNE